MRWIIRCIEWNNPDDFWKDYSGIIHNDYEAARAECQKAAVEHQTHLFMIAEVVENDSSTGVI